MEYSLLNYRGLNICVGQENKDGTDQRPDRLYVQDRRTGDGMDLQYA